HEPRGLLRDLHVARDLVGADAVLAVRKQPHREEPLVEADRRVLEHRADLARKLTLRVLRLALPQVARRDVADLFRAAGGAGDAVWPADRLHVVDAGIRVRKVLNRGLEAVRGG